MIYMEDNIDLLHPFFDFLNGVYRGKIFSKHLISYISFYLLKIK
jgi:hypothetical protein